MKHFLACGDCFSGDGGLIENYLDGGLWEFVDVADGVCGEGLVAFHLILNFISGVVFDEGCNLEEKDGSSGLLVRRQDGGEVGGCHSVVVRLVE